MDSPWVKGRPDLARYRGQWTNAAHNELLQAWAEQGLAGLLHCCLRFRRGVDDDLSGILAGLRSQALARATLAGLLVCWLAQAQMNFSLQHPAGALSLFAILLAVLVESRTRLRRNAMPPLVNEFGPLEFSLQWETMRRPIALGASLRLPAGVTRAVLATLAVAAVFWLMWCARPAVAQREYRRAMDALKTGDAELADAYFKQGLAIWPGAVDLRSRYSDVLINGFHEPQAGLDQLAWCVAASTARSFTCARRRHWNSSVARPTPSVRWPSIAAACFTTTRIQPTANRPFASRYSMPAARIRRHGRSR
jgi:hypothetical protein